MTRDYTAALVAEQLGLKNDKRVLVCDKCYRACCWYGEFMCENAVSAGLVVKTVGNLKKLDCEHPDYWTDEYFLKVYGIENPRFGPPGSRA